MDEPAVEAKGVAALKAELDRVAALKSKSELADLTASLHAVGRRRPVPVHLHAGLQGPEVGDRRRRPGRPRPPRARLLLQGRRRSPWSCASSTWPTSQKMFELLGDAPDKAAAGAKTVMDIETALAKASLDVVARRDPNALYHKMTPKELRRPQPELRLGPLRQGGRRRRPLVSVNVDVPDFFKGLEEQLKTVEPRPVEDLPALARRPQRGAGPSPRRSSTRTSPSTARR